MSQPVVGIIVGSLRKQSFNLALAKALAGLGKDSFEARFLTFGDLPLYNQDLESPFPAAAQRFKEEIKGCQGILFVTAEYNRSIPGPLKNAIDWASRPYGANAFAGKPAAVAGTSPAPTGTACAQSALKPVLVYLETVLMGQPEMYIQHKEGLIAEDGQVADEKLKSFLKGFADKFGTWVSLTSGHSAALKQKAA